MEQEEAFNDERDEAERRVTELETSLASQRHSLNVTGSESGERIQTLTAKVSALEVALAEKEEESQAANESLTNLQTVLEEFQVTREAELSSQELELAEARVEAAKAAELQSEGDSARQSVAAREADMEELQKAIQTKGIEAHKHESEARGLRSALEETMKRLREKDDSGGMIDKALVTKLVCNYFKVSGGEKTQVLGTLASMLDFNEEEERAVGLKSVGWFGWLGAREYGAESAKQVNVEGDSVGNLNVHIW